MENVVEIQLEGNKLPEITNDLEAINSYGNELYQKNLEKIKQQVKENWYSVIEPVSGTLIAASDPNQVYKITSEKYPNRLFFVIGTAKSYVSYLLYGSAQLT